MRKSKKLIQKLLDELSTTGNSSDACAKVGISRQTFYRWQKEDTEFKEKTLEAIQVGTEFINDIAKSNIISLIQRGDYSASKFWLLNRDFGFRKSIQHIKKPIVVETNVEGLPLGGIDIRVVTEKQVPDDPEEEDEVKENTTQDDGIKS